MKLLKALRLNAGLKQKDVADALGIQVSTYTKYETEPRYPVVEMLKKLADFYKFPIDFMIYHPDDELSSEAIKLISNMDLSVTNTDPQIDSILKKAKQLNAQGLERLDQYADDLISSSKYAKITYTMEVAARSGDRERVTITKEQADEALRLLAETPDDEDF